MTTTAFDTLQATRDLQEAGFGRKQAEAIAQTVNRRSQDGATKADITTLQADITTLRADVNARFAELEKRLLLAMLRGGSVAVGVVLAGVGLMLRFFG